jgi:hypothetical protein
MMSTDVMLQKPKANVKSVSQKSNSKPLPASFREFSYEQVYAYSETPYQLSEDAKKLPKTRQERLALLIHIGKAGGTTVLKLAPMTPCRGSEKKARSSCGNAKHLSSGEWETTAFTNLVQYEMHIINAKLNGVDWSKVTSLLYVLRDPIDRTVSAFNYIHYNTTKDSPFAKEHNEAKDKFYIECFPTFDDVLRTLHQATEDVRAEFKRGKAPGDVELPFCQKLAITVFTPGVESKWLKHVNVHINDNYEWYDQQLATLPFEVTEKETLVLRTENLWTDIKDLDKQLGGPGYFAFEGVINSNQIIHAKAKEERHYIQDLCCLMWPELESYTSTLDRAVNLNKAAKLKAMDHIFNSCGIRKPKNWHDNSKKGNDIQFSWNRWYKSNCVSLDDFVDLEMLTFP